MIVFDLECHDGPHRFEGWFGSSQAFDEQQARGLVTCPHCGSAQVTKAVQAPRLARKGNQIAAPVRAAAGQARDLAGPRKDEEAAPAPTPSPAPVAAGPLPPRAMEAMRKLAAMQAEALSTSRYVGDTFVEEARAMHYGESEAEPIHGEASPKDAVDLLEEGIAVMPLPFPVAPPKKAN